MPTWIDRTIRGPSDELLNADEFGAMLRVSGDYIRDRVETGDIPPPTKLGKKEFWRWEVVVYFKLKLDLGLVSDGASSKK